MYVARHPGCWFTTGHCRKGWITLRPIMSFLCDRTDLSPMRPNLPFFFFFLNVIWWAHLLFYFILFIYLWLCWVFVSVRGLSLVAASGGHSSSPCVGLSLSRPLVAEHRLQTRRLSNCGSRAQLLRGMWDLPRPGLEPVSPALAGRFSTTAPPGKPPISPF